MSIARRFIAAGAWNVIGSLWAADDRASAALVSALYRRLGAGDNVEQAFHEALASVIHAEEFRSPKYWATFQLYRSEQL